jgi:hypothetical protein
MPTSNFSARPHAFAATLPMIPVGLSSRRAPRRPVAGGRAAPGAFFSPGFSSLREPGLARACSCRRPAPVHCGVAHGKCFQPEQKLKQAALLALLGLLVAGQNHGGED